MAEKIIDACCLINLYSTGKEAIILKGCAGEFYVPTQVQSEALAVRQFNDEDPPRLVSHPIDLSNLLGSGLIKHCQPEGQNETNAYVQFAAQLDDGEASCLAIALNRGWAVATDDRKATTIASAAGIAVITTAEIIHRWATKDSPSDGDVLDVLQRIEQFARFRPRRNSPESEWWYRVLGGNA